MQTKSAYWIAHVKITDEDAYGGYRKIAAEIIASHRGKFVARGGRYAQMEGVDRSWNTVAVFPSFEEAVSCYGSPEYQTALEIAKRSSAGEIWACPGWCYEDILPAPKRLENQARRGIPTHVGKATQ